MKQKTDTDQPKQVSWRSLILSIVATGVVVAVLVTGIGLRLIGREGLSILQAQHLIESKFVGETEQSTDLTLSHMVTGLNDRWSYYLTRAGYEQEKGMRANAYVGIGVTVIVEEDGIRIGSVKEKSPAAEAGISADEIIRSVNGTKINQENGSDCMNAMRGKAGTSVSLEIENTAGELRIVAVERGELVVDSVRSEMLDGHIGYVQVENFYEGSAAAFKEA
ncbi:MAG: PDZ domain-containing protein, partial [Evtepia sp.]